MSNKQEIKKSEVESADTKTLRSLAARAQVKFIGKKTEDLRKELLAIAVDKPAKGAKKEPAAKTATRKPRSDKRTELAKDDEEAIAGLTTKKAKVITLRERGFSINAIGAIVGLHPTNVSRYIREAGLSTSTVRVPQGTIDRIKATIASKHAEKPGKTNKTKKTENA